MPAKNTKSNDDSAKIPVENLKLLALQQEFSDGLLKQNKLLKITRDIIPTGDVAYDFVLGGGLHRGRITEVCAQEQSGKTSFCVHLGRVLQGMVLPSFQPKSRKGCIIDAERALDYNYILGQGVWLNLDKDISRMLGIRSEYYPLLRPEGLDIFIPQFGEHALNFIQRALEYDTYDYIALDSKDALQPTPEKETVAKKGYQKEPQQARSAAMFARFLRGSVTALGGSSTAFVVVSQLREKPGITFGSPEVTTGGRAMKFYASTRLYMTSGTSIYDKTTEDRRKIGSESKIHTIKNKAAEPFIKSSAFIMNHIGVDVWRNAFEKSVAYDGLVKSSSKGWFEYAGKKYRKDAILQFLRDNPVEYEKVYINTLKLMRGKLS